MPFIRRLMEPFSGDWNDVQAAQTFLDHQLSLANDRRHGTTGEKPIERLLSEEVQALKILPKLLWEREEYHEGTVRKDGHVRFRGKYYSVSENLIGEDVQIVGNTSYVWIYHNGQLLETHERCNDRRRYKQTKPEHLKPWERSMQETSVYRDRARTIGPDADEFVVRVIGNGLGLIDFRKVWGLLSLDKTYSHIEINRACRQALDTGSTSLRVVRSFLSDKELSPQPTAELAWEVEPNDSGAKDRTNRFIRSISEYGAVVASSQHQGRSQDH
jgi:type II secretory pathway component PulJ